MPCPRRAPFAAVVAAVASLLANLAPTQVPSQVPSPKEFLGHDIGEDHYLCNYTDLVRYFREVDRTSDRVTLREIGRTGWGQTMLMAVITSPKNHARLEELRGIGRQLALARGVDEAQAGKLAQTGKAFVWIDAGLHATEAIAGQNIIELVWRMASRDDAEVRRILDEVVLLACPVNPDGLELVADAYMATRSMSIPVLYQRYVGHDNNRDFYTCNQIEAENVNRVFYREWFPQIVYNHHQTAPAGTIIFTPPFRDPFNYYADPNVIRGIEIVSAHMNARFARERKPGVISRTGAPYSGWWNGGLRSTNYFHNVIGILTESFGRPEPTPIRQPLDRRVPYGDYPDPVPSQVWHARQTVEYLQTANLAILDYAARYREEVLFGIWRMASGAIERGSRDHWTPNPRMVAAARLRDDAESIFKDPLQRDPRVYVLPSDQRDWAAAVRFVRCLQKNGIEVLRSKEPFAMNGLTWPAGSFVVKTAQAYRPHILDQFEPNWHPDDFKDGKPVPPYDAAGWTLSMQMDVQVERCFEDVQGPFEVVGGLADAGSFPVEAGGSGWVLPADNSHAVSAVNRLLTAGVTVQAVPEGYYVPAADGVQKKLVAAVTGLGVAPRAVTMAFFKAPPEYRQPRLGLFDVFGGNMPTGWDQWVFEQFEFPVRQVWGKRITEGSLRRDFDVLVFHTGLPGGRDLSQAGQDRRAENLQKLQAALPRFEDWSDLADRSVRLSGENSLAALKEFVEQGGTLVALGGECDKVVRHWNLPIRVGTFVPGDDGGEPRRTRRDEFYIPGSLVALDVATAHPLAFGTSRHPAAMFNANSPVFEVLDKNAVEVVASYRIDDTLVSGWAVGEEHLAGKAAVVRATVGKGSIVLFGADVTYRGQPVGTFKMLFQAVLRAALTQ